MAKPSKRARLSSEEIDASSSDSEPASTFSDHDEEPEVEESEAASESPEPVKTPKKRKEAPSSASKGKSSTSKPTKSKSSASKSTKVADLVPAPKTKTPAGQIGTSTLDFLRGLAKENEREWLQRHDAPYRHALNEFKAFVDALSVEISERDWTVPVLPARDLVHRLARDIRFSNDKTPYKTSFQAGFSRTGRKGPFAGYFFLVQPGGKTMIAGGRWGTEKNDLATIRTALLRDPKPLRRVLEAKEFAKLFGEAKPEKGKRTNVFGRDDELKNAPKLPGVDKTHKDIDLLKLKSFVVSKTFTDKEVVSADFVKRIGEVVTVMTPLVQLLNELTTPTSAPASADEQEEETD